MRSIRLSLIVFFLLLLGVALGGVSVLVYRTAAQTLRDKEASTAQLVHSQSESRSEEMRVQFDRKLLQRAKSFTNRHSNVYVLKSLHSLSIITGPFTVQGNWLAALWTRDGVPPMFFRLYATQPLENYLDHFDDDDFDSLYAQTFFGSGIPWQRTANMKEYRDNGFFPIDREFREKAEFFEERFDDANYHGQSLRRVMLKVPIVRVVNPFPLSRPPFKQPPMKFKPGPPPGTPPQPLPNYLDTFYYLTLGAGISTLQEGIRLNEHERDQRLAQLGQETTAALEKLQRQLFGIGLATFGGTVVGGFILVYLGLAPLRRLSEAVSQVSEKDFRLKIDAEKLPVELRPIVGRLTRTLDQLRQAFAREKQAAQDISHELRTPLAALITNLDVALKKSRSPEEYREFLSECKLSAKQMSLLVNRLLELAKLDAGVIRIRPSRFDLSELARECASVVRQLAQAKHVSLAVHVPDSLVVEADADKLYEIISNLLSNAVEYNREGGRIDLTLKPGAEGVTLIVADTGIGISPEVQQRIFERFYRADPSRQADAPHCGLGLSIVKSYLDLMQGTIRVRSDERGTEFEIELPIPPIEVHETQFQIPERVGP